MAGCVFVTLTLLLNIWAWSFGVKLGSPVLTRMSRFHSRWTAAALHKMAADGAQYILSVAIL